MFLSHLLNANTGVSTQISECELDELISTTIPATGTAIANHISPAAASTSQENFPFYDFPNGSYFTRSGLGCEDHNIEGIHLSYTCNCRPYAGATQCWGFALYASDRYAHITGTETSRPSTASGDWKNNTTFTSIQQMKSYFSSLTKGAYIRFSKTSTTDNGNHSIVYVSCNDTSITVYDCNYSSNCDVNIRTISYNELKIKYPYVCTCFGHTYTGIATSISSSNHKIRCSSSGCTGYIIASHYYNIESGNACALCGYSGSPYTMDSEGSTSENDEITCQYLSLQ